MDIVSTPTNTNTNTNTKSPETESPDYHQTGTTRVQAAKHLTFTNGVLKRHQQLRHQHQHHHHLIVITYKECLKNHAASLGGHALDGCGEFMPSPTATATDPTSLKCAACGCHRNFHRREPEDNNINGINNIFTATAATHLSNNPITNANATATIEYQPHHRHHPPPPPPPPPQRSPGSSSPPPISSSYYPSAPHMLLALSGNLHSAQENMNMIGSMNVNMASSSGRKRFRTKFSQSQKERMYQFAEGVGWKMQKRDEEIVQEFCNEVGVDRTVLKVWMHNNKSTFGKRDLNNGASSGVGGGRINLDDHDNTRSNNIINHSDNNGNKNSRDGHEEEDSKNISNNNTNRAATAVQNLNHHLESESIAHVATANGSSSSS